LSEPVTVERLSPQSAEEAAELVRERAAHGSTFSFVGGGTEFGLGYEPERVDVLLDTTRLNRVVDYAPADMVVSVEGGIALAALQATLAPHAQRLALDPALPERATIGGLLATNGFGPRRTRYGTLRDLVVGITIVRSDGTFARGGGKVVKNVAGFDLPKLMIGSLGSLGLIVRATFRLHPVPQCERWFAVDGLSAADVSGLCRATIARRLEPAAIVARLEPDAGSYALLVLFDGFAAGVDAQGAAWLDLLRAAGTRTAESADGAPVREQTLHPRGPLRLRASLPEAAFVAADREVVAPLRGALDGVWTAYPLAGVLQFAGSPRDGADAAAAVLRARAVCEALGGSLVVADMPHELRESLDPFGTLPPSFPIMQRLKQRFDPERRFNRGRFLGRL
jgi:glycolate oxidase FAD binding subunit